MKNKPGKQQRAIDHRGMKCSHIKRLMLFCLGGLTTLQSVAFLQAYAPHPEIQPSSTQTLENPARVDRLKGSTSLSNCTCPCCLQGSKCHESAKDQFGKNQAGKIKVSEHQGERLDQMLASFNGSNLNLFKNQEDFNFSLRLEKTFKFLPNPIEVQCLIETSSETPESALEQVLKKQNTLLETLDDLGLDRSQIKLSPIERRSRSHKKEPRLGRDKRAPLPASEAENHNTAAPSSTTVPSKEPETVEPSMPSSSNLPSAPATSLFSASTTLSLMVPEVGLIPTLIESALEQKIKMRLLPSSMSLDQEKTFDLVRKACWALGSAETVEVVKSMGLEVKAWNRIDFSEPIRAQMADQWDRILPSLRGQPRNIQQMDPKVLDQLCTIYRVPLVVELTIGLPEGKGESEAEIEG